MTGKVLERVIRREDPKLLFFGWVAPDSGGGLLWSAVGERLGLPVVSRVWQVDLISGVLHITRQMEYGYDLVARNNAVRRGVIR